MQCPYLRSRVSRAGVPRPSRRPGRTEARATAAPSPEPCCGLWVPGRLLRARPSGFRPGASTPPRHASAPFFPAFRKLVPFEGHSGVPLSLPRCADQLRRLRGSCLGVPLDAWTSTGVGVGGGTRAGAQEAGSPARPPRWAERPVPAPSAGETRRRRPERAGRNRVRPNVRGTYCARPPTSAPGPLATKVELPVHPLSHHKKLQSPTVRGLETWRLGSQIRN